MPRGETDRARIARAIREQILNGHLTPGERIPSAADLAGTYQVHPRTAQFAISQLKAEGLVTTHFGRGSYVSESPGDAKPQRSIEDRLTDVERRLDALERREQ